MAEFDCCTVRIEQREFGPGIMARSAECRDITQAVANGMWPDGCRPHNLTFGQLHRARRL